MEATARVGREIRENCCEVGVSCARGWRGWNGERLWGAVITELRARPRVLAGVLIGVALHALGQAGLALAAGLLGRSLVQTEGFGAASEGPWFFIACFGLGAAFVKAIAATFLAFAEGSASGTVAQRLRATAVSRLLTAGLHDAA